MDKPPDVASSSCLLPPTFLIGRNSKGNWVAQERSGACGGLFASRAAALKFAKFESGNSAHAVVWVSGVLELNTSTASAKAYEQRLVGRLDGVRRVA
jgi:hypothetical protein